MPRIEHALQVHFILFLKSIKRFLGEVDMTTQTYVYRGVKFTKDGDQNITVKPDLAAKVYRGVQYFKLPNVKHIVCDHVYRGAHYMA